jgi:hypothetical protein
MEENEIRQIAEQLSDDDLWELILIMRKMVAQNEASKQT